MISNQTALHGRGIYVIFMALLLPGIMQLRPWLFSFRVRLRYQASSAINLPINEHVLHL